MRLLGLCGSRREASTNRALLHALAARTPAGVSLGLAPDLGLLPVFSPDIEDPAPSPVAALIAAVAAADGLIVSSPEYARGIPGGLKNALDWLVSGEAMIGKPVFLAHASHRGDDMLEALRLVLSTLSGGFHPQPFLRLPLMGLDPAAIAARLAEPQTDAAARAYLVEVAARIRG